MEAVNSSESKFWCTVIKIQDCVGYIFQNIVRTGSTILDLANRAQWEQIQRSEGGSALLLRSFEEYAHNLAQNLRKTYLKPFTLVTDNMSEFLPLRISISLSF